MATDTDQRMMDRALQLAANGLGTTWSNPMVGAVIAAPDGRIIGEGWHREYGQGHAEVNALASVSDADRPLLSQATMYVTLEPCSHYGKTPPCAQLLARTGLGRVVVAMQDPFAAVSGRGLEMLRQAGIPVEVGLREAEARRLNRAFITAHTLRRPLVTLKWAQSADGWMGADGGPVALSSAESRTAVHALRSRTQAVMVGAGTVMADDPRLDTRHWPMGRRPMAVVLDRRGRVPAGARVFQAPECIYYGPGRGDLPQNVRRCPLAPDGGAGEVLTDLYKECGVVSVLVEGGPRLLGSFLEADLWDTARVETASKLRLGSHGTAKAPGMQGRTPVTTFIGQNRIDSYER